MGIYLYGGEVNFVLMYILCVIGEQNKEQRMDSSIGSMFIQNLDKSNKHKEELMDVGVDGNNWYCFVKRNIG